nr:AAA family ATPase [uncultured Desulfobacter sp.]
MVSVSATVDLLIPGYELNELIVGHKGTFIYRGVCEKDEGAVVLKVMLNQFSSDADLTRLRQEYTILSLLDAEFIPRVYEIIRFESGIALVQQDVGPLNLQQYIQKKGAFSLPDAISFARKLVCVLGEVHACNVLHKDINPANIVVSVPEMDPTLVDYGIASRLSHQEADFGAALQIEGTLRYIAPEQTGRMNREIDYRSDYYSIGAVLFELFSGRLLFEGTDPLALIHAHLALPPDSICQINPNVPQAVDMVIQKLLSKSAQGRYQTINGILRDLDVCENIIAGKQSGDDFIAGQFDHQVKVQQPRRLYGREAELDMVVSAFRVISKGGRKALWVAGPPGIGKSALVRESHVEITRLGGFYCAGKFDQLKRTIPYSALMQACGHLVQQTLPDDESALRDWKGELLKALGNNAQVMIDFLPELKILGEQPPVQELGPLETQNRFKHVMTNFLKVFCRPESPVMVFIDDLQWADLATLTLLEHLLLSSDLDHFLLVGAYRANEVDATHPFQCFMDKLTDHNFLNDRLSLTSLEEGNIHEMISDLLVPLSCPIEDFVRILKEKTGGNPFFLNQFLQGASHEGVLAYNDAMAQWDVDLDLLRKKYQTENVVDYMVEQLSHLPESCRKLLVAGSCMGKRFKSELLASLLDKTRFQIQADLMPAVECRLINPCLNSLISFEDSAVYGEYEFVHDRIQEAAHQLRDLNVRDIHHRISELLFVFWEKHPDTELLFDLVDHLNSADHEDDELRVELNLKAAKAARLATAYDSSLNYLQNAFKCLPEENWQQKREPAYALCFQLAETHYLLNDRDSSAIWMKKALELAETTMEKAAVDHLAISHLSMNGNYQGAYDRAVETLKLFGLIIDVDDVENAVKRTIAAIEEYVNDEDAVAALYDREDISDPETVFAMRILAEITSTSFAISPQLFTLTNATAVLWALKFGMCADAAPGFGCMGLIYNAVLNRPGLGYEYGKLCKRLGERYEDLAQRSKTIDWFCNFNVIWNQPLSDTVPLNREALSLSLDTGDLPFAGFIVNHMVFNGFYMGESLETLQKDCAERLEFLERIKHFYAYDCVQALSWAIEHLQSDYEKETTIPSCKQAFLDRCRAPETMFPVTRYLVLLTQLNVIDGDADLAWQSAQEADAFIGNAVGTISMANHLFYYLMAGVMFFDKLPESGRMAHLSMLKEKAGPLYAWAKRTPSNFSHMALLVKAEFARLDNRRDDAFSLYDEAIAAARENKIIHDEALACERAALFWLAQDKKRLVLVYIQEAFQAYRQWGCVRGTSRVAKYSELDIKGRDVETDYSVTMTHTGYVGQQFDLTQMLKSVRVISEATTLDQLLSNVMKILLEDAGASRGCLFLVRDGGLYIEAVAEVGKSHVQLYTQLQISSVQASEEMQLPLAMIQQVAAEKSGVCCQTRHECSSFFSSEQPVPASALCIPNMNQNELYGIIFLENGELEEVFTAERIQVLHAIAGQMTVSIQNSRLYGQLEQRVFKRTAELEQANASLVIANAELSREIKQRKQAQKERDAMQAELRAAARASGQAEIAVGVLHNVGNVLNSVNITATGMRDRIHDSKSNYLSDIANLLLEKKETGELGEFLSASEQGRKIPAFINQLAVSLEKDRQDLDNLGEDLGQHLSHLMEIVQRHQEYANAPGPAELESVQELVEEAIAINADSLSGNNIEIVENYDPDLKPVMTDRSKVIQILVNLISNAGKAMAGFGSGSHCIVINVKQTNEKQVSIEVKDNGIGIEPAHLAHLFEFGFTTRDDGHGFGLHTAALMARELKGELKADSKGKGLGACFTLCLSDVQE